MSKYRQQLIHVGLFIITLITTTIAGAEWIFGRYLFIGEYSLTMEEIYQGLHFSIPLLLILTVHEFGHYFTAVHHKIKVSLPYYIPLWLGFIPGFPSFGTIGAIIKIKDQISSRSKYFDVGVSGPIAGFVVAFGVLWYGFANLPEPEYIFQIHPEYEEYGLSYADYVYDDTPGISIQFGDNLLFWFFKEFVAEKSRLPHPNEFIHYPYLLAGFLALFLTALNLLPIGQLDGGHVIFGLFKPNVSRRISEIFFVGIIFYTGISMVVPGEMTKSPEGGLNYYFAGLAFYVYLLYIGSTSMFPAKRDRLMFASIMLTVQYFVYYFTGFEGYGGWLLFIIII